MDNVRPVLPGLGYVFNGPLCYFLPHPVKARDPVAFPGQRQHFIRQLEERQVLGKGKVYDKACKPGAGRHAERTSRTERMVH